jgi:predicted transcriptional regulator
MRTLTVSISDAAAESLAETAAETSRPVEDLAAQALEETFGPDWLDELDGPAQTAVRRGVAEADRGEFATDAAVREAFERFKR